MQSLRETVLNHDLASRRPTNAGFNSDATYDLADEWQTRARINRMTEEELAKELNSIAVAARFKGCDYTFTSWTFFRACEGVSEAEICRMVREGDHPDFEEMRANWRPSIFSKFPPEQDFEANFQQFQERAA